MEEGRWRKRFKSEVEKKELCRRMRGRKASMDMINEMDKLESTRDCKSSTETGGGKPCTISRSNVKTWTNLANAGGVTMRRKPEGTGKKWARIASRVCS